MSRAGALLMTAVIAFGIANPGGIVTQAAPWVGDVVRDVERASGLDHLQHWIRRVLR